MMLPPLAQSFKSRIVIFLAACGLVSPLSATTIAQWTFETSQPVTAGPISPEVGSGSASAIGLGTISSPVGNGSAHSFSGNGWSVGDYFLFQISTLGYENLQVSWSQSSSPTGPVKFNFEYSTDGVSFTKFLIDYLVLTNGASANNEGTGNTTSSWSSGSQQSVYGFSLNLGSLTGLNNAPSVYFRLLDDSTTAGNGGNVGTTGTDRVDDFTVTGSDSFRAVPDHLPIAVAFGSFVCVLMIHFRANLRPCVAVKRR